MKIPLLITFAVLVSTSTLRAQTSRDTLPLPPHARADSVRPAGPTTSIPVSERGIAITTVDATDVDLAAAPSLPIALQGRVPGASISQGQGYLGSTSRLWLRGPNSILMNQPLVIIDGARTHGAQIERGFEQRALPSRLEDIDPETIERIDVLPGIAAAAIHGPGASKGVILVTTRRGGPGPTRWSGFAESGPLIEPTSFPANFGTSGVSTSDGSPVENCPLSAQASGSCTPTTRRLWNPLETASPFRTGWSTGAGLSASGGTGALVYFGGVNHDRATGVYDRDRGHTTNGRMNVSIAPTPATDVRLVVGYRTEHFDHPPVDYLSAGLLGNSIDDANRGYRAFDPDELATGTREQDGNRTTIALTGAWHPRAWLRTSAHFGYDRLVVERLSMVRRTGVDIPGIPGSGGTTTFFTRTRDLPATASGGLEAAATYQQWAPMQTTVGVGYIQDDDRADSRSRAGDFGSSESALHIKRATIGAYLQHHVGWRDRLFLTGTFRGDAMRDGPPGMRVISSSVDAAWVALGRRAGAAAGWLDELRVRGGHGWGGGHLIASVAFDEAGRPSGTARETAERSRQIEVGADVSLWSRRLNAAATYYRATNDQGLVETSLPPSGGFSGRALTNDAHVVTSGVEGSLDARLLERAGFRWDLGVIVAGHEGEIRHLPGPPTLAGDQYFAPGSPIGEYRVGPYMYDDANGDGLIAANEVTYDDDAFVAVGSPFPSLEASMRTTLRLGGRARVSALLDHRGGQELLNLIGARRCGLEPRCEEQHDPSTSLDLQAGAVAARAFRENAYIEDASYTKLREVALALALPDRWAAMAGGSSIRLTLTGRNLATWTSYRGLDPEIISPEYDGFIGIGDFYQPPLRSVSARLDLSW